MRSIKALPPVAVNINHWLQVHYLIEIDCPNVPVIISLLLVAFDKCKYSSITLYPEPT
jgi:hypothetical protein